MANKTFRSSFSFAPWGKLLSLATVSCFGLLLLTGCSTPASEDGIITEPVTESEIISAEITTAVEFAEQNTDYDYIDLTERIIEFIDYLEEQDASISDSDLFSYILPFFPESEFDDTFRLDLWCSLLNAQVDSLGYDTGMPLREYFVSESNLILSAQEATNIAIGLANTLYGGDITFDAIYLYYEQREVSNWQNWVITLKFTLADGSAQTSIIRLDAISGDVQILTTPSMTIQEVTEETCGDYAVLIFENMQALGTSLAVASDMVIIDDPVIGHFGYQIGYQTANGATYYVSLSEDNLVCTILSAAYLNYPTIGDRIVYSAPVSSLVDSATEIE